MDPAHDHIERRVVFDESRPAEIPLAGLEIKALRESYLPVLEAAARAVQVAGHEQDDAVFDRFIVLKLPNARETTMAAQWFAFPDRFLADVREHLNTVVPEDVELEDVTIVAVGVRATLELLRRP